MNLSAETLHFIEEHRHDDVRTLALQGKKYPGVDMALAVTQISGRQIAEQKIPSWYALSGLLYPRHLSMEQCSSELTAKYKAHLLEGESFADLTGGFGIDCAFISRRFKYADYVERQDELCALAAHNFPLLDPARRDGHGGKTVAISDCEPDIGVLESLLVEKADKVMVKLSPMLDLSLALKELKTVSEVHIVSVGNECKELLLVLQKSPISSDVFIHCELSTHIGESQHYVFTQKQERLSPCPLAGQVETYLYEPNASILKAGAFRSLTQAYPVRKLHVNSHLYTSSSFVADFPGRKFKVESVTGFGKKELKAFLQDMGKANLTVRNFPSSVAELRKRLKLKEGGEDYIFATTLSDEQKVLIRGRKVNSSHSL